MTATDLSGEQVRRALLDQNYIPRASRRGDDLPPSFDTLGMNSVSRAIVERNLDDHRHVKSIRLGKDPGYSVAEGRVAHYRLNPRRIELPHPVAYANLVETLAHHWEDELAPRLESPVSQFGVRQHADGRVAAMQQVRKPLRPGVGSRFRVRADIATFYDSIYTHALPWAMLGKSVAKTNRGNNLAANDIDSALRFARRGETTGVSTGPGTSLIVAELMLTRVDDELRAFRYERFLDDYVAYTTTEADAEEFVRRLDSSLRAYGLKLNARKTAIDPLPQPDEPSWIRELRRATRDRPGELLDRAIELSQADPTASAIRWALSRLTRLAPEYSDGEARQITARLAELSFTHPYTTSALVEMLAARDESLMAAELDALLQRHASNTQTSATCWLLHHVWARNQPISGDTWDAIAASGDALATSFLIKSRAPTHVKRREDLLADLAASGDDYACDEQWPARYVAFVEGRDELDAPGFAEMRSAGVQLLRDPRREDETADDGAGGLDDYIEDDDEDEFDSLYALGLSG